LKSAALSPIILKIPLVKCLKLEANEDFVIKLIKLRTLSKMFKAPFCQVRLENPCYSEGGDDFYEFSLKF